MIRLSKATMGVAVTALLLLSMAFYAFYAGSGRDQPIRTSGTMEGIETNLASKVAGRIEEICCNEGDQVRAGQVAIRLECSDLEAAVEQATAGVARARNAVAVAESSIDYSKANVDSAQEDIVASRADAEKAKAKMAEAERKMARYRELFAQKVISQDVLDDTVTAYDSAAADYEAAKSKLAATNAKKTAAAAQLVTAEKQLELSKADLEQAAATLSYNQAKLADATIVSPISGTVVFKALEKGETVSPGVTVLTIVDLSNLYARVDIDETLVDSIVLGGEATLRTMGNPGSVFEGRVSEVGRYADFATQRDVTGGRQDIKTFKVKIAVDDPTGFLKPGMTVEVEIPTRAER